MSKETSALALFEFQHVTQGIYVMDSVLKSTNVEVITNRVVNPGKYILIVTGSYGAVQASIEQVQALHLDLLDSFLLGNPSTKVIAAIRNQDSLGKTEFDQAHSYALGAIETSTIISAIRAADQMEKTVKVHALTLSFSSEFGGKGFVALQAEVAAVQAAIDVAMSETIRSGTYVHHFVIANPAKEVLAQFG